MAISIDQVDVETRGDSASSEAPPGEPAKPNPREVERALTAHREREARVRAH
jgi:hypothetical protein